MGIFNFCQKLLRKPNEDVLDFYNRIQAYPKRNLSCCRSVQIDDTKPEESPIQGNRNVSKLQSDSDDDTEFDKEDDETMDSLLNILELENDAILELKKNSQTVTFVKFIWNEFSKLKNSILKEGEKIENKTLSEFYHQVN